MDRALEPQFRSRRRWLRLGQAALIPVVLVLAGAGLRGSLRPSVRRGELRTAYVARGPVESAVQALGTVEPLVEHVLTSPIDTRVLRVRKTPGARVAMGEPIVELDVGPAELAVSTLDEQIALKRNERAQLELELETTRASLHRRAEIKKLELQSLRYEAGRSRTLFERGVYSEDAARKADTDVARAEIELRDIDETLAASERTCAARSRSVDLEIGILDKQRREAANTLLVASTAAPDSGILTWVVSEEGAAVRRGDPLARVADLSAFRIEATVSDAHAERVQAGMRVTVEAAGAALPGTVRAVHPAVANGTLRFEATLDSPSDPRLRANMHVDVHAITAHKDSTLRIRRGTFTAPDGATWAFVVRGERAVRTAFRLGITGWDYYEIVAGLAPGDEVIVSDTMEFIHHREVVIR